MREQLTLAAYEPDERFSILRQFDAEELQKLYLQCTGNTTWDSIDTCALKISKMEDCALRIHLTLTFQ